MKLIGIFDTGFGGEYVAQKLSKLYAQNTFIVANDKAHLPYGSRSEDEIFDLTDAAIQPILHCDIIIIACNTATTIAINRLRTKYVNKTFVGFEPMIKPAATITKTGRIAILATPATLKSRRYQDLKQTWAQSKDVIEPDCANWATQIENNKFDTKIATDLVKRLVQDNVDVIALACTHYIYLKNDMQTTAGNTAQIIDPLSAVKKQLDRLLQQ